MRNFGDITGIIKDVEEILDDNTVYKKLSIESKKHSQNHLIQASVNNLINILKNF